MEKRKEKEKHKTLAGSAELAQLGGTTSQPPLLVT
jgi:hypothetical protein